MKGLAGVEFTGLEISKHIKRMTEYYLQYDNNLIYSFSYVSLTISIALVMASLLNKFVFCKIPIRMMTFMPYISSLVSVATVWMVLLYPDKGPVNSILTNVFHIATTQCLSVQMALKGIIMMSVWHDVGYYCIILLANMQGLSAEVYESAAVDGANNIQTFFRITIPMMASSIFFCITLATINSFKIFDQVNIITEGGPGFLTTVLVQAIYYYAFRNIRSVMQQQ